ncbi:uncharacterized protein TRUGW13939_02821 [Talaromyces rugulosus]|uniref:Carboxymuconolactone decarboxylase-like domain-containing protein n=1 Tax=Talaromyces rugulosus TaxID=121627 RepID=A0A7H8QP35_TALRU|nr:uncharacterized protein TRUGW13939_02821 [Talaromyces rugulosus]QKX55724.1 hypothetical protein TRUGW13939_02821 [Talaromyces rugulosus]
MSTLDHDFIQQLAALGTPYPRLKWYIGAIVALSALNYPEEIGPLYTCLLDKYIAPDDHYEQTRKIKEALVKACGLHGAAKTGNAMRALYAVTPAHLIDKTCYRENDVDDTAAYARGDEFLKSLYPDVPDLNTEDDFVRKTSPDYFHVVSRLFYPRIFSFNQILDKLESSQAIVSSLIGIDCTGQARNHMRGMMWNGATRDEVTMVRDVVVRIAERLGVQFKAGPIAVPEIPIFQ